MDHMGKTQVKLNSHSLLIFISSVVTNFKHLKTQYDNDKKKWEQQEKTFQTILEEQKKIQEDIKVKN